MSLRRWHLLVSFALSACVAQGPNDPDSFRPVAAVLQVHFVDPPARDGVLFTIHAEPIPYCSQSFGSRSAVARSEPWEPGRLFASFHRDLPTMAIALQSGPGTEILCDGFPPPPGLRFFRLTVIADFPFPRSVSLVKTASGQQALTWISPLVDLVYAERPTRWKPFSPIEGPGVDFPAGYSLLRRSCGSPWVPGVYNHQDQWKLEVVSVTDAIDFVPVPFESAALGDDYTPVPVLERTERGLLAACGTSMPPLPDRRATRISPDIATSLVWSPDGSRIEYLAKPDPLDPNRAGRLRSIGVQGGTSTELLAVSSAGDLQAPSTGELFVPTEHNLSRLRQAADGTWHLEDLQVPPNARVSPDGRWLAYKDNGLPADNTAFDATSTVQSLVDGSVIHGIDHWGGQWSPDSELVLWGEKLTLSTPDGSVDRSFSLLVGGEGNIPRQANLFWTLSGAPAFVGGQVDWDVEDEQSVDRIACMGCFNLSMSVLDSSPVREVGNWPSNKIELLSMVGVPGAAFVWERRCLGLYDAACWFELYRVSIPDGLADIVAISDQADRVAVSPDGHRLAFAAPDGIYVSANLDP
jgi:hypothetical protein